MFFHWIWIISINKYAKFFYCDRKNNPGNGALNPLGWSETYKTEIHSIRILLEPKIYPTLILPELVYTRPVFNLSARTDRSSQYTGKLIHLIHFRSLLLHIHNSTHSFVHITMIKLFDEGHIHSPIHPHSSCLYTQAQT